MPNQGGNAPLVSSLLPPISVTPWLASYLSALPPTFENLRRGCVINKECSGSERGEKIRVIVRTERGNIYIEVCTPVTLFPSFLLHHHHYGFPLPHWDRRCSASVLSRLGWTIVPIGGLSAHRPSETVHSIKAYP